MNEINIDNATISRIALKETHKIYIFKHRNQQHIFLQLQQYITESYIIIQSF